MNFLLIVHFERFRTRQSSMHASRCNANTRTLREVLLYTYSASFLSHNGEQLLVTTAAIV